MRRPPITTVTNETSPGLMIVSKRNHPRLSDKVILVQRFGVLLSVFVRPNVSDICRADEVGKAICLALHHISGAQFYRVGLSRLDYVSRNGTQPT